MQNIVTVRTQKCELHLVLTFINNKNFNNVDGIALLLHEGLTPEQVHVYAFVVSFASDILEACVRSAAYVSCKRGTAAFAAARRAAAPCCCGAGRAAIDRYVLSVGCTAANPPHDTAAG